MKGYDMKTNAELFAELFEETYWIDNYDKPTPVRIVAIGRGSALRGGGDNDIFVQVSEPRKTNCEYVPPHRLYNNIEDCKRAMLQNENDRHTKATVAIVASQDKDD